MLKKLHKKEVQKKIWIALLVLIGPAFVLWGVGSAIRSQPKEDRSILKIFGKKIALSEFSEAMRAAEVQARMQFGEAYEELMKLVDLKSLALRRLILLHEANRRKIRVSDQEVMSSIANDPTFQRRGGFDSYLYENIIKYGLHLPPRAYEEQVRQNLMIKKLMDEVTRSVYLGEAEILNEYKKENEQISLDYIAGLVSDFRKDINPPADELKNYFANHTLEFKLPLSFNLEYISSATKSIIEDVIFRLKRQENLKEAAQVYNLTVKETGLFGQTDSIPGIGWQQEVSNLLIRVKVEESFGPVEIDKQHYLFRLKDRKEPFIPEFADIKDRVRETVVNNKSRDIAKEKTLACLKKLRQDYQLDPKSINLAKSAQEFGLVTNSTDLFKDNSYLKNIGASDNFYKTGNKLKPGQISDAIEMPSGFYIVKLKDRVTVDENKYEKEKMDFSQRLLADKKQEFFGRFLQTLIRQAQFSN
jgi:peptidyl-prolyl cis-trans isomerase D